MRPANDSSRLADATESASTMVTAAARPDERLQLNACARAYPLPKRVESRRSSTVAPAARAIEAVSSVQLSATTTIRNRSAGQSSCCRLEIVFAIPVASLCAGTMTSKNNVREEQPGELARAERQDNTNRYAQAAVAGRATMTPAMRITLPSCCAR